MGKDSESMILYGECVLILCHMVADPMSMILYDECVPTLCSRDKDLVHDCLYIY